MTLILCAVWIYKVGPENEDSFGRLQYEFAVVSSCNRFPVLVLVRNTESFKDHYKVLLSHFFQNESVFTEGYSGLAQGKQFHADWTSSASILQLLLY